MDEPVEREYLIRSLLERDGTQVFWKHSAGNGWSSTTVSEGALTKMSDEELLRWYRLARDMDEKTALLEERVPERAEPRAIGEPVGECTMCGRPFDPRDDIYIPMEGDSALLYCERHAPPGSRSIWEFTTTNPDE